MKKSESNKHTELDSIDDLISFVNKVGRCYLFKKPIRVWDMIDEFDKTTRRYKVLSWCEQAHLKKRLFLSVDDKGKMIIMSLKKFRELQKVTEPSKLSNDEERLLSVLKYSMSTPELRKAINIPKKRFDKALTGLRSKFCIALVTIKKESKTKHVNCYDRIEKWLK